MEKANEFWIYSKKGIHYSTVLHALHPTYLIMKSQNLKYFVVQTVYPIQDPFSLLG
jgi:hypothetical protein